MTEKYARTVDALAEAFADLSAGRTLSPPRTVVEHGPHRQLLSGTAVWERRGVATVKITTITPENPSRGLPLIHGVVVLVDLDTGRIVAQYDGADLTALRTGATAALATRLCAPEDATELALIGAGVQARAVVEAISTVRPITTIRVHSRTRPEAFAGWARETFGCEVVVDDNAKNAVKDAPIVCTATSTDSATPLLDASWIAEGAHVNVIGGTHENAVELDPALLRKAFVVVEQKEAALADAGEVRAANLTPADLHEIGTITGRPPGSTSVFRSVGMPIEDTAAAAALFSLDTGP
ncbi:ornithine cyclodeaminase family protein [Saccharothrix variisporea]|uniref:Ornithine cyclodeaminase n=1 Tax=Saccharothrix variisporea TaxID=543527 RepID=A0A495X520_9PSEU|nr:ornithine cyclodeaminase family protein [Saccharothrix variisporea]RKT69037.1 ornithine cyclodeaminase [Saccharothrix variisporea]